MKNFLLLFDCFNTLVCKYHNNNNNFLEDNNDNDYNKLDYYIKIFRPLLGKYYK